MKKNKDRIRIIVVMNKITVDLIDEAVGLQREMEPGRKTTRADVIRTGALKEALLIAAKKQAFDDANKKQK